MLKQSDRADRTALKGHPAWPVAAAYLSSLPQGSGLLLGSNAASAFSAAGAALAAFFLPGFCTVALKVATLAFFCSLRPLPPKLIGNPIPIRFSASSLRGSKGRDQSRAVGGSAATRRQLFCAYCCCCEAHSVGASPIRWL